MTRETWTYKKSRAANNVFQVYAKAEPIEPANVNRPATRSAPRRPPKLSFKGSLNQAPRELAAK